MRRLAIFILPLILIACSSPATTGDHIVLQTTRRGMIYWILPHPQYAVAADGSGEVASDLPIPSTLDDAPRWSPNGKWIAFDERREDSTLLHIVSWDGKHSTTLSFPTEGILQPSWSPDSSAIAFSGWEKQPIAEGYVQVVQVGCLLEGKSCHPEPRHLVTGSAPAWSPDGKLIAYAELIPTHRPTVIAPHILVVNAEGDSQPTDLTPDIPDYGSCSTPDWSPDGRSIAFSCDDIIYLVGRDGSRLRKITGGNRPKWSQDGNRIAFVSSRDGLGKAFNCPIAEGGCLETQAIFIMDADGSNITRLSKHNDEFIQWFAWVPSI